MALVLTIDQRGSRAGPDLVPQLVERANREFGERLRLPFVRAAGDEVQAVLADPEPAVALTLDNVRDPGWWIGVGLGGLEEPHGETAPETRGEAFHNAREAVARAKRSRYGFGVAGAGEPNGPIEDALTLLAWLTARRGGPRSKGWEAVELAREGLTQEQIGGRLGVSQQAIAKRLRAAGWEEERRGRRLVGRLLSRAMEDTDAGR